MASATLMTQAVVTALLARERFGAGQKVELSNLSAGMWMEYYASAITLLRLAGATLETAQRFAGHANPKTTLLYDRTARELPPSEVERIQI